MDKQIVTDGPVEVLGFDCYSGHQLIVYFSDDTFATISAVDLAKCFPHRTHIPPPREDVDESMA